MVDDERLDEAVGSVAEEAARLIEVLRRRAGGGEPAGEEPAGQPAEDPAHEHVHASDGHVPMGEAQACTYCPVCRGVVLLRGVSPETLERVADVATAVATLFADLASSRTAPPPAEQRPSRTEPITVVDEED